MCQQFVFWLKNIQGKWWCGQSVGFAESRPFEAGNAFFVLTQFILWTCFFYLAYLADQGYRSKGVAKFRWFSELWAGSNLRSGTTFTKLLWILILLWILTATLNTNSPDDASKGSGIRLRIPRTWFSITKGQTFVGVVISSVEFLYWEWEVHGGYSSFRCYEISDVWPCVLKWA